LRINKRRQRRFTAVATYHQAVTSFRVSEVFIIHTRSRSELSQRKVSACLSVCLSNR